jgi:hypothetical protein
MTLRRYGFIPAGLLRAACAALLICGVAAGQTGASSANTKGTASTHATHKGKKSRNSARRRGQEKIDPARAREIQEALIREHYLEGTASGTWDASSQKAMERYQAENGWQSKQVPDARALIKLGLGPDHEHLLNPESAMTYQAKTLHSTPAASAAPVTATPVGEPVLANPPQK